MAMESTAVLRFAATTAGYHLWLTGEIPDAAFVARTAARMRELSESAEIFQRTEEEFLKLSAERILAEIAEALREYSTDRPRGGQESVAGAERRVLLLESVRLIAAAVAIHE